MLHAPVGGIVAANIKCLVKQEAELDVFRRAWEVVKECAPQ